VTVQRPFEIGLFTMNALLDITTVGGQLKIREPRHGQLDDEIVAIYDVHVGKSCVLQSPPRRRC
jgi:hypothetical protein